MNGNGDGPGNGKLPPRQRPPALPGETAPEGPRPGRRRRGGRIDWAPVKATYVEGVQAVDGSHKWPTHGETGLLHGVSEAAVGQRARRDNWDADRAAYQSHVEKVRQSRRANELAKMGTELDSSALRASQFGLNLVVSRLNDIARDVAAKAEAEKETGLRSDALWPAISAKEMDLLSKAANQFHALGAKALGDVESVRQEVAGVVDHRVSVTEALTRDDAERVALAWQALERAGGLPGMPERPVDAIDAKTVDELTEHAGESADGEGNGRIVPFERRSNGGGGSEGPPSGQPGGPGSS